MSKKQKHLKIARAYIPSQDYKTNYSPARGLRQGTIFPELDIAYQQ